MAACYRALPGLSNGRLLSTGIRLDARLILKAQSRLLMRRRATKATNSRSAERKRELAESRWLHNNRRAVCFMSWIILSTAHDSMIPACASMHNSATTCEERHLVHPAAATSELAS